MPPTDGQVTAPLNTYSRVQYCRSAPTSTPPAFITDMDLVGSFPRSAPRVHQQGRTWGHTSPALGGHTRHNSGTSIQYPSGTPHQPTRPLRHRGDRSLDVWCPHLLFFLHAENIYSLQHWCNNNCPGTAEQLEGLYKECGISTEMDYIQE